jgi:SOS response regulatory protein OraA/RecX
MTEATSRRSAYSRLLDRAVRILAMRDHSEQELRRKLAAPVMGKMDQKKLMPRRRITTRSSPGVLKVVIWMMIASCNSLSPAVAAKVMDLPGCARN